MTEPRSPLALVRPPTPALTTDATLTHLARRPGDPGLLLQQHRGYVRVLEEGGFRVHALPLLPDFPDATFVEDLGVAVAGGFVWGRPATPSRAGEGNATLAELSPGAWDVLLAQADGSPRPVHALSAPGTMDGGDVLVVGGTVLVGRSRRTNLDGRAQLCRFLEPLGYRVRSVGVAGALHLKTGCTALSPRGLLVNPRWVDTSDLAGFDLHEVHPAEPFGANVLPMPRGLLVAASAPRTRDRLESMGHRSFTVDISEFEKAEGGVTCLSLRIP